MWRLYIKRKSDEKLTVDWAPEEHAAEVEKLDCFVQWVDADANIVPHPRTEVHEMIDKVKQFWHDRL